MQEQPSTKQSALMNVAETVATLVVLNLCFLLTSLALVTILPSAVALQTVLPRPGRPDPDHPTRQYFRAFGEAWRRGWPLGCALPLLCIAGYLSVSFYLAAESAFGLIALLVLIPVLSLLTAGYLALLEASVTSGIGGGWRRWVHAVPALLLSRPAAAAGAVLLLGTAAALASRLPTLLPIGCGVVPAYIALWTFGTRRPRRIDEARLRR